MGRSLLWKLIKSQAGRYSYAVLAMLLAVALTFTIPLLVQIAIDGVIRGDQSALPHWLPLTWVQLGPLWQLAIVASVVVLLTACAGVFQYLRNEWLAAAAETLVRQLRDQLYEHIQRLPSAFHDRADSGDLVQRCTSDVETLRLFLFSQVVEIGRTVALVLLVTPLLFWLDAHLAPYALLLLPFVLGFAFLFFRKVQAQFLLTDQAEARMTTVLQENLTGIRVVRAFARQDFEQTKFANVNAAHRDQHRRLIQLIALYWSTADLLCYLQIGLTLFMGAAMLQARELSVGTLFAFLTYLGLVVWPVRQLGRVLTETGKAAVATRRLQEILREPVEADRQTEIPAQPLTGAVNFTDVCFGYGGDTPALKQVSFNIEPGQTVALVGPPGSGKSTIVQLLLRLYDYQQGSITLDGQELADLPRAFVRSQMGTVLQEPYLYSKSIAGNLRIGRHDADQPSLEQVTTAACIHDAIVNFSAGYNTLVGERGVTLSGGQRQRMAIARALLKDAPILILDDALSAIDSRTEARIVNALAARHGRHTTLVIAHRLSSVIHADRILVLQEGCVVQSGSHHELLQQAGPYRRLWQLQGTVEATIEEDLQTVVKAS